MPFVHFGTAEIEHGGHCLDLGAVPVCVLLELTLKHELACWANVPSLDIPSVLWSHALAQVVAFVGRGSLCDSAGACLRTLLAAFGFCLLSWASHLEGGRASSGLYCSLIGHLEALGCAI